MELTDAHSVPKLVKTAVRLMVNEYGAERAIVVVSKDGSRTEPLGVYGCPPDIWNDPSLPQELLSTSLEDGEPFFSSNLKGLTVVCVPLTREPGFLYCDHGGAATLERRTLAAIQNLAAEFEEHYRILNRPDVVVELEDAQDVTKLIKVSIRKLINELGAERAAVVVGESLSAEPEPTGVYGLEGVDLWNDMTVPGNILRHVLLHPKPFYFEDIRKSVDSEARKQCHPSVLCLPVGGPQRGFSGFLYADHSEAGALTASNYEAGLNLCSDFERCYERLLQGPPKAAEKEVVDEEELARILGTFRLLLVLMACSLIGLIYLL